jgi:hypothetical protein
MDPQKLAADLLKTLSDADSNTAYTALEMARLLISHRESAARQFSRDASTQSH